jgi:hypothetical protein
VNILSNHGQSIRGDSPPYRLNGKGAGAVTTYLWEINTLRNAATNFVLVIILGHIYVGTAVAQWLRYCATNQRVAGSIPDGVM